MNVNELRAAAARQLEFADRLRADPGNVLEVQALVESFKASSIQALALLEVAERLAELTEATKAARAAE